MKGWHLTRIISGGQTGADQAALRAAKQMLYATGGMMPRGWKTEAGPRPEFKDLYGMEESHFEGYEHRTRHNIRSADATLIFFVGRSDGGTGLTAAACLALSKPMQSCEWPPQGSCFSPDADYVQRWIRDMRIQILNVAGNRESKSPGIGQAVEQFLLRMLA